MPRPPADGIAVATAAGVAPSAEHIGAVASYVSDWLLPSVGRIAEVAQLAPSPDGAAVAFTAAIRDAVDAKPRHQVGIVQVESGEVTLIPGSAESTRPHWAPDGRLLAFLDDAGAGATSARIITWPQGAQQPDAHAVQVPGLHGVIEDLAWRADGGALLLGTAEAGAERSDVFGSGHIGGQTHAGADWEPLIEDSSVRVGWRSLWLHDLRTGETAQVPTSGLNVWEAGWAGPDHAVAVVSDGPTEDDWYTARLVLVDVRTGTARELLRPSVQLAIPRASPSGDLVSVIVGFASDRCLVSGDLLVIDVATGSVRTINTAGVDVTSHVWRADGRRLLYSGLAGLTTVAAEHDVDAGTTTERWRAEETCGDQLPEAWPLGAVDVALVLQSHSRPPCLGVVASSGFRAVLDTRHPGTDRVVETGGRLEAATWSAPDGLEIEGLLLVPDQPPPHPLIVVVHGGPVWSWRNHWQMGEPLAGLLASRGYALLYPNPRGSVGRGQGFATPVSGDVGGADALDVLSGIDALVERGRADAHRVGVIGTSYGGYMAAWLPALSDRFSAAVARSPVGDWVAGHFTTNIPEFDRMMLRGSPLECDSQFRERSPLYRVDDIHTPLLLIGGEQDLACPVAQTRMLYRALRDRGTPARLVVYPREGHGVSGPEARVDEMARILGWFEQYMPSESH